MRIVLIIIGILSLFAGVVGIFLPLLPTTPFILLSGYCFAKSSPRLYQWLVDNKTFGPVIIQWQQHRTLTYTVKKRAITLIVITFTITIIFFINEVFWQFLLLFLAMALITYIARIPSQAAGITVNSESDHSNHLPGSRTDT